jgi:WD40 repeat protein/serine/threonine protein kinase/Tfp pilus assembly protein PilF
VAEIPTADWSWINEAAERFERAWKKGPRPRIEDFLAEVTEPRRPPLLGELLRVERELLAGAGERPTAEEYRSRFPAHDNVVASVFAPAPTAARRSSLAPSGHATTAVFGDVVRRIPPELANHPDYEIVRELGHGGMGVVFLAHNRILGRNEVLKVIGPEIIESPGVFDRFLREMRAVARLEHPNIVSAHAAFRCGENLVFAMEYVEGLDLARMVMAKGPVPARQASYFVHQAALGLQHAHEAGMVHRDIKPSNLMLTHKAGKAVIKVLDFGLAKAGSEQKLLDPVPAGPNRELRVPTGLTLPGEMLGTPEFIAPEQITNSQGADIRADIYSLGCTLYFLVSGRPPFPSTSTRETLRAHRSTEAPLLHVVRPDVSAELAAVAARMMAKEPDRRFQAPSDVATALAPFFRKPAAASVSPNLDVDKDFAADARRPAPDPAAETGRGMWSSLIDFNETEDDADAVAVGMNRARKRPRWLWPAVVAGVLLCGLLGAWAAGVFHRVRVQKVGVALAGAEASIASRGKMSVRVPHEPALSEPSKPSSPVVEPASKTEAPAPTSTTENLAPALSEIPGVTSPPVANPLSESNAPRPTPAATKHPKAFHEIATIKTSDPVIQARLLPDANHVVYETGGRNRALWRGDVTDPKNPQTRKLAVNAPSGWTHLALSSDGRFAVLAGKDKTLWNCDLQNGQLRRMRTGRTDITAIALSPDNRLVAYVRDGIIQFCDASTDARSKKKDLALKIDSPAELIAFSPDGRGVASTHADRSIRIWDVNAARQIRYAEGPKPVTALSLFPDGRRVLASFSGPTFVRDLATNQQVKQVPGFGASIAVSANGRRALIGGGIFVQLSDVETGEELMHVYCKSAVLHVAFSADESKAVVSMDEGVRVWALPSFRGAAEQNTVVELAQIPGREHIINGLVVSRDGLQVLTSGWPNTIRLWDLETAQPIRAYDEGGKLTRSVAFSPEGNLALSGGDDKVVRLWDLVSGEHREFLGHVDNIMCVALSPDGTVAYSAGGADIRDGRRWDTDGTDFAVRVWNLETGQQLRPLNGHTGMVWSLAVSTNGRYVLSGGSDAVPILWDARTGRAIHRLRGHTNRVECVAFLPDSQRALSSGMDGTIRLWDVETGREASAHFKGTGVNGWLAVSPDGHRLFSADGGCRALRYWNLDTGKLIQELRFATSPTKGTFTPDGRHAIWGGWDGTLHMYGLADIAARPNAPPRRSPSTKKRSGPSPKTPALKNLGKALQNSGMPDEAPAEPRAATPLNPDDAITHHKLGTALHDQGKLAEAIIEYEQAIRLNPEFADAHRGLGKALAAQKKLDQAIAEHKTAIRIDSADATAHNDLGEALEATGLLAEAIAEYKRAIELKPDYAGAHNNLAWALVLSPKRPRPDHAEGLRHARRAVELAPGYFNLNTLALAEYRLEHWTDSLAASDRSMALRNGGNAWDWFLVAMARWQKGDKDEARKWFDKAVAWTKAYDSNRLELRLFWAEAAELLGQPGPRAAGPDSPAVPATGKPH